jgi:hypothetical protein
VLTGRYQHFEGLSCHHLQGYAILLDILPSVDCVEGHRCRILPAYLQHIIGGKSVCVSRLLTSRKQGVFDDKGRCTRRSTLPFIAFPTGTPSLYQPAQSASRQHSCQRSGYTIGKWRRALKGEHGEDVEGFDSWRCFPLPHFSEFGSCLWFGSSVRGSI